MRTLYVRNVPDDIAETLERVAKRHGISVNRLILGELQALVERSNNALLLDALPSVPGDPQEVVDVVHRGREERDRQIERALHRARR